VADGACGVLLPIRIICNFHGLIQTINRQKHAAGAISHEGEARSRLFIEDSLPQEAQKKFKKFN
jgi:hypothetical protein